MARRVVILVVLVLTMSMTTFATVARAQSPLDDARAEVERARTNLEELSSTINDAQARADEATREFWIRQDDIEAGQIRIAELNGQIDGLDAEIAEIRVEVSLFLINRYMDVGDETSFIFVENLNQRVTAEALASFTSANRLDVVAEFESLAAVRVAAIDNLVEELSGLQAATDAAAQDRLTISSELAELGAADAELLALLNDLERALANLEAEERQRVAAAEEQRRIDAERKAAQEAARLAAERLRLQPTALPTAVPAPTAIPTAIPTQAPPDAVAAAPAEAGSAPTDTSTDDLFVPLEVAGGSTGNGFPENPAAEPTAIPPTSAPVVGADGVVAPTPVPAVVPAPEPTAAPTATPIPQPTAIPEPTAVPPPVVSSGSMAPGWACPLLGPFSHSDDFLAPRAVGGWHKANDMIAATGVPVVAVIGGTVEHRGNSVGGMSVHLRGDDGNYYYYTHLSGYENEGIGYAAAGTVVGYVGESGNAPIPHLHFEIHQGGYGNYINPYPVLREYCF